MTKQRARIIFKLVLKLSRLPSLVITRHTNFRRPGKRETKANLMVSGSTVLINGVIALVCGM